MSVFAGDANKMLIIRQCIQASSDVLESFEQNKFILKNSLRKQEDEEDERTVATTLLKNKIAFLNSMKKDNDVDLPIITTTTGLQYPDFTPLKAKKATSKVLTTTRDERKTIVRNLQMELQTADYDEETLYEARAKMAESKVKKTTSSSTLKIENDRTLLIYYRVLVRELLIEVMTGTPSSQKIDFAAEVAIAKSKNDTVVDSNDVMDRVRTLTYTRISNMIVPSAQEMLAFTRKLKPELNTYLWFAKIYGTDVEVARLRRDIHSVIAGKLDQISAEAGMSLSMLGQYDPRVKAGTMTKYDYYVEYEEGIARQKGSTKPPTELPKPGIRLVQGASPPTSDDTHALVGLPKEIDDLQEKIQILLTGALSKNPDGQAVLEKLSQMKSTLSETYFSKKSDSKDKKPISDAKSDSKSSSKKRKSSRKSDSESDSDEPTTKTPKKDSDATARYTVSEFKEIMKLVNTPDAGNANANSKKEGRSGVCYNFQKGNCTRGANCHFEHVKEQNSRKPGPAPCFNFKRGNCNRNDCRYSHEKDGGDREQKKHKFADLLCEETIKKGYCATRTCSGKHGKWNASGELCKSEAEGKVCRFLPKPEGCRFKHVKCAHTST